MEIAPDLQFMHYTVAEAKLPADALANLPDVPLETVAICCDLERHVFNAEHTDPKVAEALQKKHVKVTVLTPAAAKTEASKTPAKHKIRYIVGGVVIVLIVIGLIVYFVRRRGMRD